MANKEEKLKRTIPLWMALWIGIGMIIGGDYFIVNAVIISGTGPSAFLAYILAGVLMMLVGLNYGELVAAIPKAGGEFNYVTRAFGDFIGWIFTWMYLLPGVVVIGVNAIILSDYTAMIYPPLEPFKWIIRIAVVLIFFYITYRGVELTSIVQSAFAIVLVTSLLVFAGIGIGHANLANLRPFLTHGHMGFLRTITFATLFYIGFDMVPQMAEEIKAPRKAMGKLTVYIVMAVGIVLTLSTLGAVISLSQSEIGTIVSKEWGLVVGFKKWIGHSGMVALIIGGGFTGAITTLLGCFYTASRGFYALGRAGRIPAFFSKIHPKYKTPYVATIVIMIVALIFCIVSKLVAWVSIDVLVIVAMYIMVVLSLIKLRKSEPSLERPFKVPGYPVLPVITVILSIFFLVIYIPGVPRASWIAIITAAVIGLIIWFGYWMRKPKSVREKYDKELNELEPYIKTEE